MKITSREFQEGINNLMDGIELFHGTTERGKWMWIFKSGDNLYVRETEYSPIPSEVDLGVGEVDNFYVLKLNQ